MQAKAVLRNGEPDRALAMLEPVFDEIGVAPPALRLLHAEALGTKNNATASDKTSAATVVRDIRDQVPPADLSRAAAAIDPKLPAELGLPGPVAPGPPRPPGPRATSASGVARDLISRGSSGRLPRHNER